MTWTNGFRKGRSIIFAYFIEIHPLRCVISPLGPSNQGVSVYKFRYNGHAIGGHTIPCALQIRNSDNTNMADVYYVTYNPCI